MGNAAPTCCDGPTAPLVIAGLAGNKPEWFVADDEDPDIPPPSLRTAVAEGAGKASSSGSTWTGETKTGSKTSSALGSACGKPETLESKIEALKEAMSDKGSPRPLEFGAKTLDSLSSGYRSPTLSESKDKAGFGRNGAANIGSTAKALELLKKEREAGEKSKEDSKASTLNATLNAQLNRGFMKESQGPLSPHDAGFGRLAPSRQGTQDYANVMTNGYGNSIKAFQSEASVNMLKSTMTTASVQSNSWLQPRSAMAAAMNYLGLKKGAGPSNAITKAKVLKVEEFGTELLEFALAIVTADSHDANGFMHKAGPVEREALIKLTDSARTHGIMGGPDSMMPVMELAKAFITQTQEQVDSRSPMKSLNGPHGRSRNSDSSAGSGENGPKKSLLSKGGKSTSSLHLGGMPGARRQVTFDELPTLADEEPTPTVGLRNGYSRSLSTFSATSFGDFNERQNPKDKGSMPSFLDFVTTVGGLKTSGGLGLGGLQEELEESDTKMVMAIDLDRPMPQGIRSSRTLDLQSEAGMSYHSMMDDAINEDKPIVQAEVMNLGGGVKIAFQSRCLRTQNEWQSHMLHAQKTLLDTISGQLKEKETILKASGEVMEEEKEILRGFRKIISREVGEEDGNSSNISVVIVEQDEEVRVATEEVCKILEYPVKSFRGLTSAIQHVARSANMSLRPVESKQSAIGGTESTNSAAGVVDEPAKSLLDGRPGSEFRSWRADTLLGRKEREAEAKKAQTKMGPSSASQQRIQVVLLSRSFLDKGIPPEWQQDSFYVVLTSSDEEFEQVGTQLMASGEAKIRERLRSRGFKDYLLHPLSVASLRSVVQQALRDTFGDEYLLLQAVGRGTSGVVHKAKRVRDGSCFALKEINTKRLSKNARRDVQRERQLLQELHWPTVIFMVDTWESPADKIRYILMPLLEGGNLLQCTEAAAKGTGLRIESLRVTEWYAQCLHGMAYLHWRGVVHCDVKPGNLLLASDNRLLQIGDLGSAMLLPGLGPHPSRKSFVFCAANTAVYCGPEVLSNETYYTASDVWSVGMSFLEVLTAQTLFPADAPEAELKRLANEFDSKKPGALKLMYEKSIVSGSAKHPPATDMVELLGKDPLKRPMCVELCSRPTTERRLRDVLVDIGAVKEECRKRHFEDCQRIRTSSEAAADLEPQVEEAAATPPTAGRRRRGSGGAAAG